LNSVSRKILGTSVSCDEIEHLPHGCLQAYLWKQDTEVCHPMMKTYEMKGVNIVSCALSNHLVPEFHEVQEIELLLEVSLDDGLDMAFQQNTVVYSGQANLHYQQKALVVFDGTKIHVKR
jgi:hypothetical protein